MHLVSDYSGSTSPVMTLDPSTISLVQLLPSLEGFTSLVVLVFLGIGIIRKLNSDSDKRKDQLLDDYQERIRELKHEMATQKHEGQATQAVLRERIEQLEAKLHEAGIPIPPKSITGGEEPE
jgi:uncharacterized protein YicC (UPF0701 family)